MKPDSWWIVRGPDGRSDREKQAARHVEEREARLGAEAAGRFAEEVARQDRHLAQMMQTAADEREMRAVSAILDAFIASSRTSDEPATVEVGKGAVIAVAWPSQGQAAAQLALARGGDIAVLAPGILNNARDILTNSVHLANDKGLTVIALMNESKGLMFTGAGRHGGGSARFKTAAAIDLLEATASEFGVPTTNSELAESVLTPLNAALEGQNDLQATVIGHSRGAIDVENAALSAGGYPNLDLITIGGAASPTREHWKSRRAVVAYDPVPYAALLRSALLGRGDTLPLLVPEVGHSFASYYEHIFASAPPTPRFRFDSMPGMLNRSYLRQ